MVYEWCVVWLVRYVVWVVRYLGWVVRYIVCMVRYTVWVASYTLGGEVRCMGVRYLEWGLGFIEGW